MTRLPAPLVAVGILSGRYMDIVTVCRACERAVCVICSFCGLCLDCCGNGFECPGADLAKEDMEYVYSPYESSEEEAIQILKDEKRVQQ